MCQCRIFPSPKEMSSFDNFAPKCAWIAQIFSPKCRMGYIWVKLLAKRWFKWECPNKSILNSFPSFLDQIDPSHCGFSRINQAGFVEPFSALLFQIRSPEQCQQACLSTILSQNSSICRSWTHDSSTNRCYLSHLALRGLGRNVLEQLGNGLSSGELDECMNCGWKILFEWIIKSHFAQFDSIAVQIPSFYLAIPHSNYSEEIFDPKGAKDAKRIFPKHIDLQWNCHLRNVDSKKEWP